MRILIQSTNFRPELTGIGKYTGEMADWLAARGHDVRVVTTPPHYPQWRVSPGHSAWRFRRESAASSTTSMGTLEVFRCPVWIPRVPRGWKRVLHLSSFALGSLPMMLRQIPWRADVVLLIAPTLLCSLHAICVARLSGGTAWLHVQDFEVDVAFQLGHFASVRLRQFAELLEGFLMRKFDRVSAISDRMVERLSEKGVNTNRRALFPNWVDTATIFPMSAPSRMRRELAIPDQAVVLLYSGSMGTKHGLELLADASRRLASRADIRFVFCGEGPYREALVRLSEESRNVIVLPLQPDDRLNELLNVADIHVLPQLASAADLVMPSKLTGMMASGRPVVATARVGTQISRALEGSGIITPPGDVDAFVCAVIRLAADHDLRRRMGEKARQYAVTYMSRDEILREFELSMMIACGRCQEGPPGLSKYENRSLVARELAMSSTKRDDDGPLK